MSREVCFCGDVLPMHLQEFMQRGGYTYIAECQCGMKWVANDGGFIEVPQKRKGRTQFTWRSVKCARIAANKYDDEPNPITAPLQSRGKKRGAPGDRARKSKKRTR